MRKESTMIRLVGVMFAVALLFGCASTPAVMQQIGVEIIADEAGCYLVQEAPKEVAEILPLMKDIADGKVDIDIINSIATKLSELAGGKISPRMGRHIQRLSKLFVVEIEVKIVEIPAIMQGAAGAFVDGAEACGGQ